MNKTIGIIGGGNMGEALIKGLVEKKLCVPAGILVCEADPRRTGYLKKKYRVTAADMATVAASASTVILAVKPQDMENVLGQLAPTAGKLFLSIAAGLTTQFFESRIGKKARVVRAMPNMPALIGQGITGICRGRFATAGDLEEAVGILGAVGECVEFQEKDLDAVTAVSGSGPAYVFLFVEQWMAAAQSLGLSGKEAKDLVYQTLCGSANLLKKSDLTAGDLRSKVTSKGGTTEAAMKVFLEGESFGRLMKRALLAAKKRAKELAK